MDPREEKLPLWAKQLIAHLRLRISSANEPLLAELAKLRPRVELLERRNGALTQLLQCAANGGHVIAHDIVEIIEGYDLVLSNKEE